jgi:hypothetical protein
MDAIIDQGTRVTGVGNGAFVVGDGLMGAILTVVV